MEEMNLRVIPVHKSLIRPQLMLGCDRTLFFVSLLMAILLIFPAGIGAKSVTNIVLGAGLFFCAQRVLIVLAKVEPSAMAIFRRSILYRDEYPASALVERR